MMQQQRPLGRPRREQNAPSTKEVILSIATATFLEKGYPFVSMDDVAQKCDVTKATIYYYYKTKADLFTDAMVQLMVRIKKQIVHILSAEEPLYTRLSRLAKTHLQATVDIDINSFMREARTSLSGAQLKLMQEAEDDMYLALEEALKIAMSHGEISQANPRFGALLFISMLTTINNIDLDREQLSLDELITEMVDLYWNGLTGLDM